MRPGCTHQPPTTSPPSLWTPIPHGTATALVTGMQPVSVGHLPHRRKTELPPARTCQTWRQQHHRQMHGNRRGRFPHSPETNGARPSPWPNNKKKSFTNHRAYLSLRILPGPPPPHPSTPPPPQTHRPPPPNPNQRHTHPDGQQGPHPPPPPPSPTSGTDRRKRASANLRRPGGGHSSTTRCRRTRREQQNGRYRDRRSRSRGVRRR